MECYICTEKVVDPTRICACTSQHLHVQCQRRLLQTVSQDGRCTICRQRYSNVIRVRTIHLQSEMGVMTFLSYLGLYTLTTLTTLCILTSVSTAQAHMDISHMDIFSNDTMLFSNPAMLSVWVVQLYVQRYHLLCYKLVCSLLRVLLLGTLQIWFLRIMRAEIVRQIASSADVNSVSVFVETWIVDDVGTPKPEIA